MNIATASILGALLAIMLVLVPWAAATRACPGVKASVVAFVLMGCRAERSNP